MSNILTGIGTTLLVYFIAGLVAVHLNAVDLVLFVGACALLVNILYNSFISYIESNNLNSTDNRPKL